MKNTKEKDWYDSPNMITYMIIGLLIILIISSQSFAIQNNLGAADIFRSILNHNSIYVITLLYFILIRMKFGKKYFDYLNVLMVLLYVLLSVASLFTIFQSFGLASLLSLASNLLLTIYFVYAFLCHTELGKELRLDNSPLAELNNSQYFYIIVSLQVVILIVGLVGASSFESVVIALLEVIYKFLLARYIYLYKEFIEHKEEAKVKVKEKVKEQVKEEKEPKKKPKTEAKKEGEEV